MSNWIKCSNRLPPKDCKFLFSYSYGIGLGNWSHAYQVIQGNSERIDEKYILVLWPSEINDGDSCFQWDEKKLIEMDVSWMPLPKPPTLETYYELEEFDGKRLCYSGVTTDFEKVKDWVKEPNRLFRVLQ